MSVYTAPLQDDEGCCVKLYESCRRSQIKVPTRPSPHIVQRPHRPPIAIYAAQSLKREKWKALTFGKGRESCGCQYECALCLDDFEEDAAVMTLACGHVYHTHCIQKWLDYKNFGRRTCPICRRDALPCEARLSQF